MASDFRTALGNRRSYYEIGDKSPIPDPQIKEIIDFAVDNTPSAFNSQSARIVLLLGGEHKALWEIVREALRKIVPADKFKPTDDKIDSFAAGRGTVLFYEDQATVRRYQEQFALYRDAIPGYSENSAGMLQLAVWVMLRDAGLGASLQHYGNLIEKDVAARWNLDAQWRLIAQMPFGAPLSEPDAKDKLPLDITVKMFA